jgi:lipopolysaccharide transport system ATP-binding protein
MRSADMAIRVEGVSKIYRIGVRRREKDSLARAIVDFLRSPVSNYRKYRSLYRFDDIDMGQAVRGSRPDIIWALSDVGFEVKQGEALGIIGRNGAGKSTLLKILTRITAPTRGRIEVRGRVSSLLEVGTGFHQELTGRENIYLNGTILGMSKREIDRKFDEIVDFSGMEKFLDTPIKRFSSGMTVRLAFAVAAHLDPEILIIDEVLAVGDAAFQRKCIGKMQDVGRHGRTILFVSHNMATVTSLCKRAMLLDEGRVVMTGSAHDVVGAYLNTGSRTGAAREWPDPKKAPGGKVARLRSIRIVSPQGQPVEITDVKTAVGLEMTFEVTEPDYVLLPHYYVFNEDGTTVFGTLDQDASWYRKPRPVGTYRSTAWIPANSFSDGLFFVSCSLITRNPDTVQFDENQIIAFRAIDAGGEGTARGDWTGEMPGVVRPLLEWTTDFTPARRYQKKNA